MNMKDDQRMMSDVVILSRGLVHKKGEVSISHGKGFIFSVEQSCAKHLKRPVGLINHKSHFVRGLFEGAVRDSLTADLSFS